MSRKPLTRDERHQIRSIWMSLWNKQDVPSMEEAWYEVILDFLQYQRKQVISMDTKMTEALVIERGLEKEYFACLMDIIKPPMDFTEEARFIMLLQATPDEREKALRFVLAP